MLRNSIKTCGTNFSLGILLFISSYTIQNPQNGFLNLIVNTCVKPVYKVRCETSRSLRHVTHRPKDLITTSLLISRQLYWKPQHRVCKQILL